MANFEFTVYPRIDERTVPVYVVGFKSESKAERFQTALSRNLTEAVENNQLDSFEMTNVAEHNYPAEELTMDQLDAVTDNIINLLK